MITITIPEQELYDEVNNRFIYIKRTMLKLEHSLLSVSKWESKYKKSFISQIRIGLKGAELLYYVQCMTINKDVDPDVYYGLDRESLNRIIAYINDPMTATKIYDLGDNKASSNKPITAEEIYYSMFKLQIPLELERWHLNRLTTLINVFNVKDNPKKMSSAEAAAWRQSQNAKRKAKRMR